jgi:hypothetical protein
VQPEHRPAALDEHDVLGIAHAMQVEQHPALLEPLRQEVALDPFRRATRFVYFWPSPYVTAAGFAEVGHY